jgi:transcriptional regulator with XRE-family HTH domain
MGSGRNNYGRKASKEFGTNLRQWREDADLRLDNAARKLGLTMKKPGAYLSMIETGQRPIPHIVLQNIPEVYGISPEKVMMRAYWPQLRFPILDAVEMSSALSTAVEEYLAEIEKKLDEDQKKELMQFAAFLLLRNPSHVEK